MRIVVTYRSRYGHARSYAEWIADDLGAELIDLGKHPSTYLADAAAAILVTPIYARSLFGAKVFAGLAEHAPEVPLVGVTVGASDPDNPANLRTYRSIVDTTFSDDLRDRMRWFHVRGGLDYPRMSMMHRAMMWMVTRKAKRNAANGDAESRAMLESYGKVVDFSDRATIAPVVEYVRSITSDRS